MMKKTIIVFILLSFTMGILSGCGNNITGEYVDMWGSNCFTVTDDNFYYERFDESMVGTYEVKDDIVYVDYGDNGLKKYKITDRYGTKALQSDGVNGYDDNNIYSYYVKKEDFEKFRDSAIKDYPELND